MSVMEVLDLRQAQIRLAELDRERALLARQLSALQAANGGPDIGTAEGRVSLFYSLFRGRRDVFATRWTTKTAGRSGWAPRCRNEWRPGVCFKPKVKCADCANRRFVPLTPTEIRGHLEGRQTVGIYPLLPDETCWLVAIDLDGASWRDDVGALRESAEDLAIPVLIERSRSGEGAHVWVLFAEPVAAHVARSLGSLLLTRGMSHRTISMSSYDRLFPNQETMPAGGFGNLIALPLQHARRRDRRVPSRGLTMTERQIDVTLGGRIQLPASSVPPALRDRLCRTAAFANPMFYERERARLSTHKTPRVIACHEQLGESLLLPRGCLARVIARTPSRITPSIWWRGRSAMSSASSAAAGSATARARASRPNRSSRSRARRRASISTRPDSPTRCSSRATVSSAAYCGQRFMLRDLSRDHVVPVSRGGRDVWTNSVTACRRCNTKKANRSPEAADMPLLYVPYVPNRHEHFILRNRRILADQMEYLLAGVPRTSRLYTETRAETRLS